MATPFVLTHSYSWNVAATNVAGTSPSSATLNFTVNTLSPLIPASTKIGVFRQGTWYVDMDGNGTWDPAGDAIFSYGQSGDIPVIGDWNGTGVKKIGVFRAGSWYLDASANFAWTPGVDTVASFGLAGDIPVVGDWGNTGSDQNRCI